jgi:hypothetical protein
MQNMDTETKKIDVSGYVSNVSSSTQLYIDHSLCPNAAQAEMATHVACLGLAIPCISMLESSAEYG